MFHPLDYLVLTYENIDYRMFHEKKKLWSQFELMLSLTLSNFIVKCHSICKVYVAITLIKGIHAGFTVSWIDTLQISQLIKLENWELWDNKQWVNVRHRTVSTNATNSERNMYKYTLRWANWKHNWFRICGQHIQGTKNPLKNLSEEKLGGEKNKVKTS